MLSAPLEQYTKMVAATELENRVKSLEAAAAKQHVESASAKSFR
jgi:hypothetical protein